MISSPSRAFELQQEMVAWWQSPNGRAFGRAWVARAKDPWFHTLAEGAIPEESRRIAEGTVYWVGAEMCDLIAHAARSMPEQVFHREDLPDRCGVVMFEKALRIEDVRGRGVNLGMMVWTPTVHLPLELKGKLPQEVVRDITSYLPPGSEDGVVVTGYSDKSEPDDYLRGSPAWLPPLVFLHIDYFPFGKPIMAGVDAEVTTPDGSLTFNLSDHPDMRDRFAAQRQTPFAFWTLVQQSIACVSDQQPQRHLRRRAKREGVPAALYERPIRVVTLRRVRHPSEPAGEHERREWSRRWIVSGHWRNQWLPSVKRHRLQWIAPYVKGPDDKPLITPPTVKQWVR